jgi:hypothetical protein
MNSTRRSFLGGLAVASALSSAAAAHTGATVTAECPDLLALGTKFDAAHERFMAAIEALIGPTNCFRSIAPEVPATLIAQSGGYAWKRGFTDFMTDPADPNYNAVVRDERGGRLQIVLSHRVEAIYGARFGPDSRPADFSNASECDMRLYEAAKAFESQTEDASEVSGLTAALAKYRSAQETLRRISWDLCGIRARTPAGVALKVRATGAYAAFGSEERLAASSLLARAIWEDMGEDA